MKKLFSLMALFVVSLLMVSMVSAVSNSAADNPSTLGGLTYVDGDLTDGDDSSRVIVEVNGDEIENGATLTVEEGETLDISVELMNKGTVDAEGIEVLARISGYEYSDYEALEDTTHVFNVRAGTRKTVDLSLDVPYDIVNEENTLRVFVLDRNGQSVFLFNYPLYVESARHSIDIVDVSLSPGTSVQAGRSLLASVLLENQGEKDEEDIKVTVSLPELGVSATEYVDSVDNGDAEDVPEMFLPIPSTVAAGEYTIKVTAQYDDLRETVTKVGKVTVLGNAAGPAMDSDKLVLAVGPESQNVAAGATATYGIALTNAGKTSKAYTLEATTGDWATATVSDALIVLSPGQNKVVYVKVAANADATAGEHLASVVVKSGSEVLETVPLKATVTAQEAKSGADFSLRNGLEIALIVLVVLLVVIGLIVGFSRLRKDEEEEEQTYY